MKLDHFTSMEIKRTLKPKAHQPASILISKMFLILTQDQQNERIVNQISKNPKYPKTV
jgi:hypothetical protein